MQRVFLNHSIIAGGAPHKVKKIKALESHRTKGKYIRSNNAQMKNVIQTYVADSNKTNKEEEEEEEIYGQWKI